MSALGVRRARGLRLTGLAAKAVIMLMLLLLFVSPLISVALSSLKTPVEASQTPPSFFPTQISFENYAGLGIGADGIWHYALNSVIVTLGTVALTVIVALLASYGFSRAPFRGSGLLFGAMLAAMMVPFQVILTPLFLVTRVLHVDNTLFGLILVYTTFQLPFSIFLLKNSFDSIPGELFEAAEMDGAGRWRTLVTMLPLVRPGLVTAALFAFFAAWNEFIAALVLMSDQRNFTLPILLTTLVNGQMGSIDWGVLQAGVVLTIIPCAVIFLILQRHYVSGLVAGSIK